MRVLKENISVEFLPARFSRRFEQLIGLKLSHVCVVAIMLAAMYIATESYSGETGYFGSVSTEEAVKG